MPTFLPVCWAWSACISRYRPCNSHLASRIADWSSELIAWKQAWASLTPAACGHASRQSRPRSPDSAQAQDMMDPPVALEMSTARTMVRQNLPHLRHLCCARACGVDILPEAIRHQRRLMLQAIPDLAANILPPGLSAKRRRGTLPWGMACMGRISRGNMLGPFMDSPHRRPRMQGSNHPWINGSRRSNRPRVNGVTRQPVLAAAFSGKDSTSRAIMDTRQRSIRALQ